MLTHFFHLLLYSGIVATFFAVLLRRDLARQLKLGGAIWLAMAGGSLVLGFLMYPFPS